MLASIMEMKMMIIKMRIMVIVIIIKAEYQEIAITNYLGNLKYIS